MYGYPCCSSPPGGWGRGLDWEGGVGSGLAFPKGGVSDFPGGGWAGAFPIGCDSGVFLIGGVLPVEESEEDRESPLSTGKFNVVK